MSIKIGNLDVSSFKVGGADCSIYIGDFKMYPNDVPPTPHDYSKDYFTFRVTNGGTIRWNAIGYGIDRVIQYSINDGEWTSITAGSSTYITVAENDVVRFKGENQTYASDTTHLTPFDSGGTAIFNVEGNIMSLIYGDNFSGQTVMTGSYNFMGFLRTSKVVSTENLVLPSTVLTTRCYNNMFQGCTSLTTAPKLPATTLSDSCYRNMFYSCTSLTTAPELPATTLVNNCYNTMFYSCTSLSAITCLATDISASNCTANWVNGVAASGTFTKAASMTSWTTGNNGMPSGWTVQDYTG